MLGWCGAAGGGGRPVSGGTPQAACSCSDTLAVRAGLRLGCYCLRPAPRPPQHPHTTAANFENRAGGCPAAHLQSQAVSTAAPTPSASQTHATKPAAPKSACLPPPCGRSQTSFIPGRLISSSSSSSSSSRPGCSTQARRPDPGRHAMMLHIFTLSNKKDSPGPASTPHRRTLVHRPHTRGVKCRLCPCRWPGSKALRASLLAKESHRVSTALCDRRAYGGCP